MAKSIAKKASLIIAAILILFTAGVVFELKELLSVLVLTVTVFFVAKNLEKQYFKAVLFGIAGLALILANRSAYESVREIFTPQPIEAATNFIIDGQSVPAVLPPQKEEEKTVNCTHKYPENITPWCELIEKSALKYSLDPLLIASVMLQESGGNNNAGPTIQNVEGIEYYTSISGAVGLMQVMPRNGIAANFLCPNGPCFAKRPSIQELQDPSFNIDYGSEMLSGLIKKYGNNRDALAAYGPYDVGYQYADLVLAIYSGL